MATSSFFKDFVIDSKKAADSLAEIMSKPSKGIKIDRTLTSPERERAGEEKLKKILIRQGSLERIKSD